MMRNVLFSNNKNKRDNKENKNCLTKCSATQSGWISFDKKLRILQTSSPKRNFLSFQNMLSSLLVKNMIKITSLWITWIMLLMTLKALNI